MVLRRDGMHLQVFCSSISKACIVAFPHRLFVLFPCLTFLPFSISCFLASLFEFARAWLLMLNALMAPPKITPTHEVMIAANGGNFEAQAGPGRALQEQEQFVGPKSPNHWQSRWSINVPIIFYPSGSSAFWKGQLQVQCPARCCGSNALHPGCSG